MGEIDRAIQTARKKRDTAAGAFNKQARKNRRAYEEFHKTLALFAGGTIALTITYLGYLKSLSRPVLGIDLLIWSWAAFLLCTVTSLFYLFLNTHYAHFALLRQYFESMRDLRTTEAGVIPHILLANVSTSAEQADMAESHNRAANQHAVEAERYRRSEDFYFQAWKWCGRTARFAYPVGLALLYAFAVRNA